MTQEILGGLIALFFVIVLTFGIGIAVILPSLKVAREKKKSAQAGNGLEEKEK